jgi:hypothetical protein
MPLDKFGEHTPHFNALSPGEAERLACLAEECSEVIKCVTKILRHGYASRNPKKPASLTNRHHLELEIADVLRVVRIMGDRTDIRDDYIAEQSALDQWGEYAHHNAPEGV